MRFIKKYAGLIIFTTLNLILIYVVNPTYYNFSIYAMLSLLFLYIVLTNVIKFLIIRNSKGKFFLCDVLQSNKVYDPEDKLKKYEVVLELVSIENTSENKVIKFLEDIAPRQKYYVYYSDLKPNYYIVFSKTGIFKNIVCVVMFIAFSAFTFLSLP